MEKGIYPDYVGMSEVGQNVKKFLNWWHCAAENWFDDIESLANV